MTPNILHRLFLFVPNLYYGSNSYISRGPLSVLAKVPIPNIAYFSDSSIERQVSTLFFPVSLAKLARYYNPYMYKEIVLDAKYTGSFNKDFAYPDFIEPYRRLYISIVVFIAMIAIEKPSFVDLVRVTQFAPKVITSALAQLFKDNRIYKTEQNTYRTKQSYKDVLLAQIDGSAVSRLRSKMLAVT